MIHDPSHLYVSSIQELEELTFYLRIPIGGFRHLVLALEEGLCTLTREQED